MSKYKLLFLGMSLPFLNIANAQISLEENKSLSQIQQAQNNEVESQTIKEIKKQIQINANIVSMGMVCGFPEVQTESLHNFFLLQFGKYKLSTSEVNSIVRIHKDSVAQGILIGKDKIKPKNCEKFKPEFEKIFEYAKNEKSN